MLGYGQGADVGRRGQRDVGTITGLSLSAIRARYFAGPGSVPPPEVRAALARDSRAGAAALLALALRRLARQRHLNARQRLLLRHESRLWRRGLAWVAGVDEVGMGPLAGPVVAAAVVLPPGCALSGVDDSKVLDAGSRQRLFTLIQETAAGLGIGVAEAAEVDRLNVYQAGLLAMARAVAALPRPPDHLLVDARRVPGFAGPQESLVGGDGRSLSIAAASIVAKVTRDRIMDDYDRVFPQYGFARHKGYATAAHRQALRRFGRTAIHRSRFFVTGLDDRQALLFHASGAS